MAQKGVDDCLLCAPSPCACKESRRKVAVRSVRETGPRPAAPKVALPKRAPAGTPKPPAAPRVAAPVVERKAELPQPRARFNPSTIRTIRTDEEEEMRRAILVLVESGLVHWKDIDDRRREIDLPSWRIDALIWQQQSRREE